MKKSNSIKTWANDDMPREKMMEKGEKMLSNSELLAILFGSGNQELSAVGLAKFILTDNNNSLSTVSKKNIKELCGYKGIGPAKAVTLKAAFELGKRYSVEDGLDEKKVISSSDSAFKCFYPYLNGLTQEEFWCLFLSRSNQVISIENISKGGLHSSIVDLKVVFKKALLNEACGLIVAHNHPSGSSKPSQEDIKVTKKIKESALLLDMVLLDHLILYKNTYYSFMDEGLLS